MEVAFVLVADEAYFIGVAALLSSVAINHGRSTRVILLRPGTAELTPSDAVLERIAERLQLKFELRPIGASRHQLDSRFSSCTHFRLFDVPDHCGDVDRVVYLDADVLLLSPADELLSMDLAGKTAAAAVDLPAHPTLDAPGVLPGWPGRERFKGRPYFNSGVLVIDLERWRRTRVSERAVEFLAQYPESTRFYDQDSLNVALIDDWLILDPRWNLEPGFVGTPAFERQVPPELRPQYAAWEDEARIWHFMGSRRKPWKASYPAGRVLDHFLALVPREAAHWLERSTAAGLSA
jgi:lipopolysaccharide biosynthesis glycosyltransferase